GWGWGSGWDWALAASPRPAPSVAGTSIPPATQIVDAGNAVWTVSAGVIYRNGVKAGFSANVVRLYWDGSTIYQQNSAGGWWSWNGSDWAVAASPVPLPSTGTRAVATFRWLGLYWSPPSDPGAAGCEVRYRKVGDADFKSGLNLWYDARNSECRGSLVMLTPGTGYEVQFALPGQSPIAALTATTWSESFPI